MPTRVAAISRRGLEVMRNSSKSTWSSSALFERIEVEGVELVRRKRARQKPHRQGHGFWQHHLRLADMRPEIFEAFPRPLAPAAGEAAG